MNYAPTPLLDGNVGEPDLTTSGNEIDPPTTQMRARLNAAFRMLPPFTRTVFLAHRLDDLSYIEIATITGVSVRRIEQEIARAIIAIDRALWPRPLRRKWWRGR